MTPRAKPFVFLTIVAIVMLALHGHWSDPWILTYMALWAGLAAYGISSIGDGLARERFSQKDPGADSVALTFVRLTALAHLAVGALDSGRWHLFPVPTGLRVAGLAGMVLFGSLIFRAMIANQFFSAVVRIQSDRGHRVIDGGPYALVRHPGYAGMILAVPCSGLALGSWLAVAFALAYSLMIVRRVAFEDAFLRTNLDGYADYRTRVRYRVVPGLW